jgi:hypothetical protein
MNMSNEFSNIDVNKIRQLRSFKIDYSNVHNLEYTDKDHMMPQTYAEYQKLVPPAPIAIEEQPRPLFTPDLRYLQNFSALHYQKGKMLVLVNYDLYPLIKSSVEQYIKDVAYEGYYATAYRVRGGSPTELRNFIKDRYPVKGLLLVGNLPDWSNLEQFLPEELTSPLQRRAALSSTLLAGLEMARGGAVRLRQEEEFGPILVRRGDTDPVADLGADPGADLVADPGAEEARPDA